MRFKLFSAWDIIQVMGFQITFGDLGFKKYELLQVSVFLFEFCLCTFLYGFYFVFWVHIFIVFACESYFESPKI
jgi:hypothetical protein